MQCTVHLSQVSTIESVELYHFACHIERPVDFVRGGLKTGLQLTGLLDLKAVRKQQEVVVGHLDMSKEPEHFREGCRLAASWQRKASR